MNPGPAAQPAPRVFICYRRGETAAHAGRLYDAMATRFGESNVFMDVDIAPGVDFVKRITEVVSACQVLIVVMGPSWATCKDEDGGARISDPNDFVRLEVETALRRPEVTPIPVLVSGARMPRTETLPAELQPITRRNAMELSEARWRYDVGQLNSTLDELLSDVPPVTEPIEPQPPEPVPQPTLGPSAGRLILEGALVAGATAFIARSLANKIPESDTTAGEIAGVILRRGETWGLTGAALAAWLAFRTRRAELARLGLWGLLIGAIAGAVGGALWAVPALLPNPDPSEGAKKALEVLSLAVTGGFLGAMIGALWRPPRLGAGLVSGAAAGALIRVIVNGVISEEPGSFEASLAFAVGAIAIAGLAIATALALDRRKSAVEPTPAADAATPEWAGRR